MANSFFLIIARGAGDRPPAERADHALIWWDLNSNDRHRYAVLVEADAELRA